jgi:hypothetical protein
MKINIIILLFFLFSSVACQNLKTKRLQTSNKKGKVYFHTIKESSKPLDLEVFVDGRKVSDLVKLDKFGLELVEGKHEIDLKVTGFKFALDDIKYNLKKGQELHFYYCENDSSLHTYVFPVVNGFNQLENGTSPFNEFDQVIIKRRSPKKICFPN